MLHAPDLFGGITLLQKQSVQIKFDSLDGGQAIRRAGQRIASPPLLLQQLGRKAICFGELKYLLGCSQLAWITRTELRHRELAIGWTIAA